VQIHRHIAALVVAMIAVGAPGVAVAAESVPTYTVSGIVTAAATGGLPVGLNEVRAGLFRNGTEFASDYTNASGEFTITGVKANDIYSVYYVKFSASRSPHMTTWWNAHQEAYSPQESKLVLTGDVTGITQTMPEAGIISGRVSLGTDRFAGANEVEVHYGYCYDANECYPSVNGSVMTDAEGRYEIRNLESATWALQFTYKGGVEYTRLPFPKRTDIRVDDAHRLFTRDAAVPHSGEVRGLVSLGGRPATAGEVTVKLGSKTTSTDVNGRYEFTGLPAGTATLTFANAGPGSFLEQSAVVDVTGAAWNFTRDVTLPSGVVVRGTVTRTSGEALADIDISIYRASDNPEEFPKLVARSTTAADGTYAVSNLRPGLLKVIASTGCGIPPSPCWPDRGWTTDPEWSTGDLFQANPGDVFDGKNIALAPGGYVLGSYACGVCEELNSFSISNLERRNPKDGSWHYVGGDFNGIGYVTVFPGEYRVTVSGASGLVSGTSRIFTIAEDETVDLGEIPLTRSGFLSRSSSGTIQRQTVTTSGKIGTPVTLATKFPSYKVLLDVGDISGDGLGDIVARSSTGKLVLHAGTATGFDKASTISTGWNSYKNISAPGDVNGDGNLDLVAQSSAGTLYMFPGNGLGKFGARKSVGTSSKFKGFSKIVGVETFDTGDRPDLVAKTAAGVVYLIASSDSKTFDRRIKLSSSWTGVSQIVGIGAFGSDNNRALIVRKSNGDLMLHKSDGNGHIVSSKKIATGWSSKSIF
jgi:hypothetical protein